ncbi:MAG: HEPN domain-containing protein [Brevinematales bacterium]|nr:HEPN domain-containing protein [Brevinematales bacterium]
MTEYAVEARYPDDYFIPSADEANEAYRTALKVRDFVLSVI